MLRRIQQLGSLPGEVALSRLYFSREGASVGENSKVKKLSGLLGSGNNVAERRGVRVRYGL
jgi:hypothetical protein